LTEEKDSISLTGKRKHYETNKKIRSTPHAMYKNNLHVDKYFNVKCKIVREIRESIFHTLKDGFLRKDTEKHREIQL